MRLPRTKELVQGNLDRHKPYQSLILILESVQELLQLPNNNFCWTYWNNAEEATAQVTGLLNQLKTTKQLSKFDMDVLFAPTGPLQEVSLNSGWSKLFIKVAEKYDQITQSLWPAKS